MKEDKVHVYFDYSKNAVYDVKESEMNEHQANCIKRGLIRDMRLLIRDIINTPKEVQDMLIKDLNDLI
jgi:hypothetical protein